MKKKAFIIAAIIWMAAAASASAQSDAQLTVDPQTLRIDTFYNGTSITATGTVPKDSDAILRFMGASCDLPMKEKGRVFGIMWMNLDSLTFRGVPSVCIVSSALDFGILEDGAKMATGGVAIKALRLAGIEDTARIESPGADKSAAFQEFFKLKQGEGLYREMTGNISYGPAANGLKSFKAEIPIPSRLTPGAYMVELAAVKDGQIIASARKPMTADLVGFPALLARLAYGHSALYGVLAATIAILAGLGIGVVFQSKGAH